MLKRGENNTNVLIAVSAGGKARSSFQSWRSELAPLLGDHLVISIAAGIRAKDISRWMGGTDGSFEPCPILRL